MAGVFIPGKSANTTNWVMVIVFFPGELIYHHITDYVNRAPWIVLIIIKSNNGNSNVLNP